MIICREHATKTSFCCCCWFYNAHLNSVTHMCAHTYTQSVPINTFHRAFPTKLIMRNRCHHQHRTTVLTALQTALRHRHQEINDRTTFVDDPRNPFYSTAHMYALYRLIPVQSFTESCHQAALPLPFMQSQACPCGQEALRDEGGRRLKRSRQELIK